MRAGTVTIGVHVTMSRRTNGLHDAKSFVIGISAAFCPVHGFRARTEMVVMRYVWAPQQRELKVVVENLTTPLSIDHDGWWCGPRDLVRPGEDYRFEVQGQQFPDPRSGWQPAGVRGPSRRIDHGTFRWTDRFWQSKPLASAVIYELHMGTFTPAGTFEGAIERLEHLVDLGITHVEVMPVAEYVGNYGWGYDGVFPFAPHHAYGGPDGFKRFVNACHTRGLGVILDVVYNHLGPVGNVLPIFGPYFNESVVTPWGAALNFDGPDSDEVRRYFCDNARMWLEDYHVDGLRLDAVHTMPDRSAVHVLEQLAAEVDELEARLGRHLFLTAESDSNDPRVVRSSELGGFGIDAQWSDDIHHAVHGVLSGETVGYYRDFGSLEDLATAMKRPYVYAGRPSRHRRRRHGRPPENLPARKFIAFLQNHDQLGNRARGDRIGALAGVERMKIGAALVLLSPYVPLLFQGEEWNASTPFRYFVDFQDEPELAQAVAEGRRREFSAFGWKSEQVPDPTEADAFFASQLNWGEIDRPEFADVLEWYRRLIRLRKEIADFAVDRPDLVRTEFDEQRRCLVIERGGATIACNFAREPTILPVPAARRGRLLIASRTWEPADEKRDGVELPAETVVVWAGLEKATSRAEASFHRQNPDEPST
jgi:maltooligosyltrehalose trehalohydrolase